MSPTGIVTKTAIKPHRLLSGQSQLQATFTPTA
jgi:hypothetical protein